MSKTGLNYYDLLTPHVGEKYVFGAIAPKDNAKWAGPWDCAEFVSWGIYQLVKVAYGWANNKGKPATADSYTGFLARDAEKIGIKIPVAQALRTPGAILLRVAANGTIGHTAVVNGYGGTIEAYNTAKGVIKSTSSNRRWDYGILIKEIEYTELLPVPDKKPGIVYRWTTPVMKGPVVTKIQSLLKLKGYYRLNLDGKFEGGTHAAVKAFQSDSGLNPDGEVGPKTAAALGVSI